MAESFPLGLWAGDFNPEMVRLAFHSAADLFLGIRDEWRDADRRRMKLMADDFKPHTSGYEHIVSVQYFFGVRRLHAGKLKGDRIPFILKHADPSLRDRIQRVIELCDPDSIQFNNDGHESERWRQKWEATGLDGELEELVPMLRAEGDRIAIQASGGVRTEVSPQEANGELTPAATKRDTEEKSVAKKGLPLSRQKAGLSFEWVSTERPDLVSSDPAVRYSREQYEHIKANHDCIKCEGGFVYPDKTDVPSYATWAKYIREWLLYETGAVNSPRAGRETGRSIVKEGDL